jgi:PadR family transcriptional regulator, regulatory protein PadR
MNDTTPKTSPRAKRSSNPDFLNGVPELVVLELLSRRPMYGYEIVQAIQAETSGALAFGEGCIYPLLHKLEASGDLASRRLEVGGRSRVVYRVTAKGTKQFVVAAEKWSAVVTAVGTILQGGKHAHARSA